MNRRAPAERESSGLRACPRCGALNGRAFSTCVRCGRPLPTGVETAIGGLDGSNLLGTKLLGAITLAVFAGQMAPLFARGQLGAMLVSGGTPEDLLRAGALWIAPGLFPEHAFRLVSAVFVHFGVVHLLMNLMAFADLGRMTEPAVGTSRFTLTYVLAGIVGFVVSVGWAFMTGAFYTFTAGASGAVFGLMGLAVGWMWRRRSPMRGVFLMRVLLYGVVIGFVINAGNVGFKVNNAAHLGGLITGGVLGLAFAAERRPFARERWLSAVALFSVAVVLGSLLLARLVA